MGLRSKVCPASKIRPRQCLQWIAAKQKFFRGGRKHEDEQRSAERPADRACASDVDTKAHARVAAVNPAASSNDAPPTKINREILEPALMRRDA